MAKELLILDFKIASESAGKKIYLLESGAGLFSGLPAELMEAVSAELMRLYPGKTFFIGCDQMEIPEGQQVFQKVSSLYQKLVTGKHKEPGVLVFANPVETYHAYQYIREKRIPGMDVYLEKSTLVATDKMFFASFCKKNNLPIPETWVSSSLTTSKEKLQQIKRTCPDGVIIKPVRAGKGQGVAFVSIDQLDEVVSWLNRRSSSNPLAHEPRFMEH